MLLSFLNVNFPQKYFALSFYVFSLKNNFVATQNSKGQIFWKNQCLFKIGEVLSVTQSLLMSLGWFFRLMPIFAVPSEFL